MSPKTLNVKNRVKSKAIRENIVGSFVLLLTFWASYKARMQRRYSLQDSPSDDAFENKRISIIAAFDNFEDCHG